MQECPFAVPMTIDEPARPRMLENLRPAGAAYDQLAPLVNDAEGASNYAVVIERAAALGLTIIPGRNGPFSVDERFEYTDPKGDIVTLRRHMENPHGDRERHQLTLELVRANAEQFRITKVAYYVRTK